MQQMIILALPPSMSQKEFPMQVIITVKENKEMGKI